MSGVLKLPEGPMIIITHPIVTSHEQGPIKGTLTVAGYNNTNKPSNFNNILPSLSKTNPLNLQILGPDSIASYTLIKDIYGNPGLILKSEMSKTLYKSYLNSILDFIASILLVGIFFVGLILYSLDKRYHPNENIF